MEALTCLDGGSRVLDLACGAGSFDRSLCRGLVVGVDRERPGAVPPGGAFVQADAAALPFAAGAFDAVVCNHGLEHIHHLGQALVEVGRVTRPGGFFFAAVPDASTLCDRLYRWLGRGGGHVNAFRSPEEFTARVAGATGLPHAATRYLLTSFSYLNRRGLTARPPRRLLLLGGGHEAFLVVASAILRLVDWAAGTRLSLYGWACWFGVPPCPVATAAWANVCARCGAGHPSGVLPGSKRLGGLAYRCPRCLAFNFFTPDRAYARLRQPPS